MAKKLYWRVNDEIRAPEVRVIGSDDKQVDVMTRAKALELAKKENLDLVEIAPKARPPVVKIINFGKFKYQEEKKARKQKAKTKQTDVKEVRFSPFIADGDYNTRMERIREFIKEGHKIRAVVKFKGRQMGSKKFGYDLMKQILNELGDDVTVDMEPKFLGRHLAMVISPLSDAKKQEIKNKEKEDNNAETKN